jgi:hypothetical protein
VRGGTFSNPTITISQNRESSVAYYEGLKDFERRENQFLDVEKKLQSDPDLSFIYEHFSQNARSPDEAFLRMEGFLRSIGADKLVSQFDGYRDLLDQEQDFKRKFKHPGSEYFLSKETPYDNLTIFGDSKSPQMVVYSLKGKVVGYLVKTSQGREMAKVAPSCKISDLVEVQMGDHGSEGYSYYNPAFCAQLPEKAGLIAQITKEDEEKKANAKLGGEAACSKAGGTFISSSGWSNGSCRCPNDSYIFTDFQTCYDDTSANIRFHDFQIKTHGDVGGMHITQADYDAALAICKENSSAFAPLDTPYPSGGDLHPAGSVGNANE